MEQARIVKLPSGFGASAEVLRATYQSQNFTRHTHDTYTFGLVLDGVGAFWCRGRERSTRKGDIVVIPPGEVHTGRVGPGAASVSYVAIYLPVDLAVFHGESVGLAGGRQPDFSSVVLRDPAVRDAFQGLDRALGAADVTPRGSINAHADDDLGLDEAAAEETICVAITQLLSRHAERYKPRETSLTSTPREPRVADMTRAVIDDCYANARATSLHALSENAGVTPFRIIRAFRAATGLSPHHYLIQVRVAHARQLLAEGVLPSRIAAMTGFVDQSHLTYHFKKHVGVTPSHYQRCVSR